MTFQTNVDCIHEVLKCLRHDTETLHSCLLVNRLWCELSVPILWKDPWARFFNLPFSKPSFTQPIALINTYISSLTRESILKLEKNGFNLSSISSSTTFNYPMYLRCLDLEFLYWLVMKWVQNKSKPGFRPLKRVVKRFKNFRKKLYHNSITLDSTSMPPQDKIRLVCSELLTLFLKESPKIYILRINDYSKVDIFGPFGDVLASLNPKHNCLSSLKGLECRDKPVMDNIFEHLSLLTTDITQILIMGNYNTKTLANLIKTQKKLEKVCCENFYSMSLENYWESGVGYELSKKAHFITSLHLLNSCSLLIKLPSFVSLQELTIQCIREQSCEYGDCLTSKNIPVLRDLAKLKFRCMHDYSLEYLTNLVENSGGKLRKITIEGSRIKDTGRCNFLIYTIANKCPNLKSCSIPILRTDPRLDRLLESCEQLKDLKLFAVPFTLNNGNNDILLNQLIKSTPTRLRRLDFVDWIFSKRSWELFLKSQSKTLLQRICYYWNENSKIASPSEDFLKFCHQNKKDGIITTYKGIDSYWK
ncbi:8574_t:CDS:1, partial [Scutellospora calospora]